MSFFKRTMFVWGGVERLFVWKTSKPVIWRLACWRLDIRQSRGSCESMHNVSDHRAIAAAQQANSSLLNYIIVPAGVLYIHTGSVPVLTTWPARLSSLWLSSLDIDYILWLKCHWLHSHTWLPWLFGGSTGMAMGSKFWLIGMHLVDYRTWQNKDR